MGGLPAKEVQLQKEADYCSESLLKLNADSIVTIKTTVTNCGDYSGGETVQVYIGARNAAGAPKYQLKALKKIPLEKGETKTIEFNLDSKAFGLFNDHREKVLLKGIYDIYVGAVQPDSRSFCLTGNRPQQFAVECVSEDIVETV